MFRFLQDAVHGLDHGRLGGDAAKVEVEDAEADDVEAKGQKGGLHVDDGLSLGARSVDRAGDVGGRGEGDAAKHAGHRAEPGLVEGRDDGLVEEEKKRREKEGVWSRSGKREEKKESFFFSSLLLFRNQKKKKLQLKKNIPSSSASTSPGPPGSALSP